MVDIGMYVEGAKVQLAGFWGWLLQNYPWIVALGIGFGLGYWVGKFIGEDLMENKTFSYLTGKYRLRE